MYFEKVKFKLLTIHLTKIQGDAIIIQRYNKYICVYIIIIASPYIFVNIAKCIVSKLKQTVNKKCVVGNWWILFVNFVLPITFYMTFNSFTVSEK